MAGITLAQAEAKLQLWMDAEEKLATSQSYAIDTGAGGRRQLTRADLGMVAERIKYWQQMVTALSPKRRRTRYVVPDTR